MSYCVRLMLTATLCVIPMVSLSAQSKDKKSDPEQIGNRDVGKGVNFYSLEKEIALGKQLAQEIERQAKFVDAPIPAEYVNRLAQNLARNSDIKIPVTAKLIRQQRSQCLRTTRRLSVRQFGPGFESGHGGGTGRSHGS